MAKRELIHQLDSISPNAKALLEASVRQSVSNNDFRALFSDSELEEVFTFTEEEKQQYQKKPIVYLSEITDELVKESLKLDFGEEHIIKYPLLAGVQYSEVTGLSILFSDVTLPLIKEAIGLQTSK